MLPHHTSFRERNDDYNGDFEAEEDDSAGLHEEDAIQGSDEGEGDDLMENMEK